MTTDLPQDIRATLDQYHFRKIPFEFLRDQLASLAHPESMHAITQPVLPPSADVVASIPPEGSSSWRELHAEGIELLRQGRVALVILAGGMATRFGSKIKGLCPLFEGHAFRFLDGKLLDVEALARTHGVQVPPVAIMTSFATDGAIRDALAALDSRAVCMPQFVSMRLNANGSLFMGKDNRPSLHATGHGDLSEALAVSGVLQTWKQSGVQTVLMSNVDNLGATLDPVLLALHRRANRPITVELVDKIKGDKGGLPVRLNDKLVLAEAFRLPSDFPHDAFPLFNTNTLWMNLEALESSHQFTWCVVRKKVDGVEAIQFERLVGELTWWHETTYVRVPREGVESRFIPIKEQEDLVRAEAQLRAVLKSRAQWQG